MNRRLLMNKSYSEAEIDTLLNALTTGSIDDAGLKSSVATGTMRQKDIDMLVTVVTELQKYKEIGTVEECARYKEIALKK